MKKIKQNQIFFFNKFLCYLLSFIPIKYFNIHKNSLIIIINPEYLENVLLIFKKHINCQFSLLSAISGVDYLYRQQRFVVVYELLSIIFNTRIRVKVFINENYSLPSIKSIFSAATWWEREIWDLFGIFFIKNNEIKRILTDYGFEGYPLRKDFPLSGYVETRYDENLKRVVCEPLEHLQEFRSFNFSTGWSSIKT